MIELGLPLPIILDTHSVECNFEHPVLQKTSLARADGGCGSPTSKCRMTYPRMFKERVEQTVAAPDPRSLHECAGKYTHKPALGFLL